MSKYQLIIRYPSEQLDDVSARQWAREKTRELGIKAEEAVLKLQKLEENAEPVGVHL